MASNKQIARGKSASRIRHLVGFSALIMLIFSTVVVYQGSLSYRQALSEGESDARRLAHIMSDHVELTFLGTDLALRRAIERQYLNTMFGNNLTEYMEQNFRVWLGETPQIIGMAIVSAAGEIKVAAHKQNYDHWLDYTKGFSGDKLFESMRDADDRYVFIGKLETAKGDPLIIISRRYNLLNGEFGGIVVAAIDPAYLTTYYQSVAFGYQKYMSLTLSDGTVLASGPTRILINEMLVQSMLKNSSTGELGVPHDPQLLTTSVNNTIKIAASRQLTNLPITLHLVLDESDVLAGWRASRAKDIGFLALFTVFGSVLSFFAIAMARQIVRAEESEEAAILASQAKSEFLANMSHELRTPLNAIIGFSEMMNTGYFGPLTPKQRERVHDINLCGTHLLQLISDILEFSKGDAGKLELIEEKVDLLEIINESERMMSGKIRMKNINFSSSYESNLPSLWGDKRKIRQVMLNLLSNAIKFTPEGGSIKVICMIDNQGALNLIVSDTGIGIAEEDISRALSVFGQVHRGRSHEGTGLGLPLCKMYAELHGGKLVLSSKLNEGTSVRVIFPSERTLAAKETKIGGL